VTDCLWLVDLIKPLRLIRGCVSARCTAAASERKEGVQISYAASAHPECTRS